MHEPNYHKNQEHSQCSLLLMLAPEISHIQGEQDSKLLAPRIVNMKVVLLSCSRHANIHKYKRERKLTSKFPINWYIFQLFLYHLRALLKILSLSYDSPMDRRASLCFSLSWSAFVTLFFPFENSLCWKANSMYQNWAMCLFSQGCIIIYLLLEYACPVLPFNSSRTVFQLQFWNLIQVSFTR
jgi:hypothetical protein